MLRKLVGCNLTVISTIVCFIVFKRLVHHEYDYSALAGGVFFIIGYSVPFIGIAGVISFIFDKVSSKANDHIMQAKIRNDVHKSKLSHRYIILRSVFHVLVGFVTACISALVFRFTSLDLLAFLFVTCIVGSIVFQCSYFIHNRWTMYGLGIGLPIGIILFSFYIL